MADSNAERLADFIAMERRMEVESEFYEEVNQKTYDEWYAKAQGRKYASKAGFSVFDGQMFKYYMIAHPKAKKHGMTKAAILANKLMGYGKKSNVSVSKDGREATVLLRYERTPAEYVKGTYVEVYGDTEEERHYIMKSGRSSALDKLILRAVNRWRDAYGVRLVSYASAYKED